MENNHKLSLAAAILININVMLGSGIFINVTELTHRAGWLGSISYLLLGFLLLPLVLSFAYLLNVFPAGNFYTFGSQAIHPFVGFLSSWSYFTGKLSTATLTIHVSVLLLQQLLPTLLHGPALIYDLIILLIFLLLNLLRISTGSKIQHFFLGMKLIPVLFIIFTGIWLFNGSYFTADHSILSGIPSTLPLVLFASLGFEVACSLSSKIKDSRKNAPIAILASYGIVIAIAFCYQLFFYALIGPLLGTLASFKAAFPLAIQKIPSYESVRTSLLALLNIGIASSALGGSYGVLFSNSWNLHTIAQHGLIPGSRWFTQLNRYDIPWLCIVAEGLVCVLYFFVTRGNQIPLQQMAVLGCIISYSISIISLFVMQQKGKAPIHPALPLLALLNCALLAAACVYGFFIHGLYALILFTTILALGIALFWYQRSTKHIT